MARNIGMAALVAALVGVSLAAVAQDTASGVTVLRGNNVTSEGVSIGVGSGGVGTGGIGTGGTETASANAANEFNQTGNVNARRTGSANAGGEIGNPLPGAGR